MKPEDNWSEYKGDMENFETIALENGRIIWAKDDCTFSCRVSIWFLGTNTKFSGYELNEPFANDVQRPGK